MRRSSLLAAALVLLFATAAQARQEVTKTYCMSLLGRKADAAQVKAELLLGAKRMAVAELFGEMVSSLSRVKDFTLSEDEVSAASAGYIRLAGDPVYRNGPDFGEVCVTITAYAEDEDFRKLKPVTLSGKKCLADPNLTTARLKEAALSQALSEALLRYEPGLEGVSRKRLGKLVHQVKLVKAGFLPETETYCVEFEAQVFPVEVAAALSSKSKAVEPAPLVRTLPASAFSASTVYGNDTPNYGPQNSRLTETATFSNWSAAVNDGNQWLQADLGQPATLCAISTLGRAVQYNQFVTEYKVSYSLDGAAWTFVKSGDTPIVFAGNRERLVEVRHDFPEPITARYVRIHPVGWNEHITLRWELWGAYEKD